MEVRINAVSFVKNEIGLIYVKCENIEHYSQIQVEVFDTGSRNPKSVLGFGTELVVKNTDFYEVKLDTKHLKEGVFELKVIIFHSIKGEEYSIDKNSYIGGRNYKRVFFEVVSEKQLSRNIEEIEAMVISSEQANKNIFFSGIDIRESKDDEENKFIVFLFIKGVLTGTQIRFDKFEIVPFHGLDITDHINLTNEFLASLNGIKLSFPYDKNLRSNSQNSRPVSIVHFPCVVATNWEEANNYCSNKVNYLIQALSLTRGGSGSIFNVVVFNCQNDKSQMFMPSGHYPGNRLTGALAGEHPESMISYTKTLEENPFKSFLVNLHKEAISETDVNYKYVRYWQILEILAESKNYDSNEELLNFDGEVMFKQSNGKNEIDKKTGKPIPLTINNSKNRVFNLLRRHGMGNAQDTWNLVNTWLALRDAVAHFGSIREYQKLRSKKAYAEAAIKKIDEENGHDKYIWSLKEEVKFILMRELLE